MCTSLSPSGEPDEAKPSLVSRLERHLGRAAQSALGGRSLPVPVGPVGRGRAGYELVNQVTEYTGKLANRLRITALEVTREVSIGLLRSMLG